MPNSAQPNPGVLWTQPTAINPTSTSPSNALLPPLPSHLQKPPTATTTTTTTTTTPTTNPTTTPPADAMPSVLFYPVNGNQVAVPLPGTASGAMTSLPPLPAQTFRFNGQQQRPVFPFGQQFTLENPANNEAEEENNEAESSDEESSDDENV